LFGQALFGLSDTVPIWAVAAFLGAMVIPLTNGSNQAIWQAKVAPDVQGRVFATRRLIAWLTTPITPIIAGVLADRWLEPAMQPGGALTGAFSGLVGTGPGAGMALMLIVTGLAASTVGVLGYLFPAVRDAEARLPINAVAIWAAITLLNGNGIDIQSTGWVPIIILALIFGLLNALVRPVIELLTCPLIILTLGLGTLLINTLLFWLTGLIGNQFGIGFTVTGFWPAFLGALIVSVVSMALTLLLRDELKNRRPRPEPRG